MRVFDERVKDPQKFMQPAQEKATEGMILTDDPEWNALEYARHDPANKAGG